jgi:F0F1-type ATP synthase assembly protein I
MKKQIKQNSTSLIKREQKSESIIMIGIFLGINTWAFTGTFVWGLIVFVFSIFIAQFIFWK